MSTISITPTSTVRPRLRITRRGRAVLTGLAALPVVLTVGLAALNGGQAAAGDHAAHTRFDTVTVEPGESLWQLAQQEAPSADPRDFVQDVVDLNNLPSSGVQAGQKLAIPAQYSHRS
jgi:LysM repeat protein